MSGTRLAAPNFDAAADTPLRRALRACRKQFVLVGLFSGAVNLLQLTTSIYMMQVFDRVLATRVLDTLLYLSLIAGAAVLVLALLEAARGQIMQRVAAWIENRVAPEGFVRAIESTLRGRPYRMEALRDLAVCRGYLGSPGALSLYDVPWVPIYIAVIFLLHPVMGWIALGGALILFGLTLATEFSTSRLLREANTAAMASQRRADAIARNAEVIDSMGMLPSVIGRWRDTVGAMAGPQQRAADRAAVLVAATKFFRLGGADRDPRRRRLPRARRGAHLRRLDRRLDHHGPGAGAGGADDRRLEAAGAGAAVLPAPAGLPGPAAAAPARPAAARARPATSPSSACPTPSPARAWR